MDSRSQEITSRDESAVQSPVELLVAATSAITADLGQALELQDKLGVAATAAVEQIQALQKRAEEEMTAFNARAERLSSPYVLSPELAKVLRVARVLNRPLLLEGEPGTGKTSLSYAVAGDEDLPIIHAQCKSTTTAQDLLYTFDVVRRLQDAQLGKDVSDLRQYVQLGPLGRAFASGEQVVLVIDEVDKAKREFANDLLHELDQMAFFIPETGEEVVAKHKPIVIITSNHERDLPEPVLRRCVYHYIEFPDPEQMTEIVKAHIPDVSDRLLQAAITRFYEIRQTQGLEKKPSTSEILDWIRVLREFGVEDINQNTPYLGTLLKHREDIDEIAGVGQNQAEQLRDMKMPEGVVAALMGEKVVRIKTKSQSQVDRGEPDNAIYTLLANQGYPFVMPNYYNDRPFDIKVAGFHKVDTLVFAFRNLNSKDTREYKLYQLLLDNSLIAAEYVVDNMPVEFVTIQESNELYTKGTTREGREVYRTRDGRVVFEQPVVTPERQEEQ